MKNKTLFNILAGVIIGGITIFIWFAAVFGKMFDNYKN